jgi:hypothetical protein
MSETMAKPTLGQPTVVFQVTMRPFEATGCSRASIVWLVCMLAQIVSVEY